MVLCIVFSAFSDSAIYRYAGLAVGRENAGPCKLQIVTYKLELRKTYVLPEESVLLVAEYDTIEAVA